MGEPFAVLMALAGAALVTAILVAEARAARRAYQACAASLGLPPQAVSGRFGLRLRGQVGEFSLSVREGSRSEQLVGTSIEVAGPSLFPEGLTIRPTRRGLAFGLAVGHSRPVEPSTDDPQAPSGKANHPSADDEIVTGDLHFDEVVSVRGAGPSALAVLDHETRALCAVLVRGSGLVRDGRITLTVGEQFRDGKVMADLLRTVLDLASRLAAGDNVPERLADNARRDPIAAVRLHNLRALRAAYPQHGSATEALRHALADQNAGVRVFAGVALGAEGRDCLQRLVQDRSTTQEAAEEATLALGGHLLETTALARLADAISLGHDGLAQALLARLGSSPSPAALARLEEVLASFKPWLACAAAASLGHAGGPRAEQALVGALTNINTDVRAAAAEALGHAGSLAAIPALRETASGNLLSPAVRRAAAGAIAAIRGRVAGAAPGQLALADGEVGALALASAPGGAVSLEDEDSAARDRSPEGARSPENGEAATPPPARKGPLHA